MYVNGLAESASSHACKDFSSFDVLVSKRCQKAGDNVFINKTGGNMMEHKQAEAKEDEITLANLHSSICGSESIYSRCIHAWKSSHLLYLNAITYIYKWWTWILETFMWPKAHREYESADILYIITV